MLQFSNYEKDFDEQMKICNNSTLTKYHYKSDVKIFFNYFKTKPSIKHVNSKEVVSWLLTFETFNTRKAKHSAVKWFYKYVIHQKHKFRFIPYGKPEKRLPIIIDQQDVQKMFDVCENLKHKTIMATLYGTGIRKGELLTIKISDILSKQGVIRIIGKGNKERLVPLNNDLLILLREYYKKYMPVLWLFENDKTHNRYSARSISEFLNSFKAKAQVTSPVTPHKFRHSFATQLLDNGTDIRIIQGALGHENIKTTMGYTHVSRKFIAKINSPLNSIRL